MSSSLTTRDAPTIRLVLIDDHELVLASVVRLLKDEPDMFVAATATTACDGVDAIRRCHPDVVVVDYQLPDGNGAAVARAVAQNWPEIRVIMLTGFGADTAVFDAERSRCDGYIEKTKAPSELVAMIRRVRTGGRELPSELLGRLPSPEELVVHYQPIFDLWTGDVMGYEALVRWAHVSRGVVPPGDFVPLAERTGLITDIGEHVRRKACYDAAIWSVRSHHQPPRLMQVNVSGRELLDPGLLDRLRVVLEETELDPAVLVVEITESCFVGQADENTRRIAQLKDIGLQIALDDFGTGYSSLSYLGRFPIDIIKLDKSFVDELPHGAKGLRLLDAVGHLCSEMGAVAQAEGIETAEQAACLLALGWRLGQGFYYGRPMPAEAVEAAYES